MHNIREFPHKASDKIFASTCLQSAVFLNDAFQPRTYEFKPAGVFCRYPYVRTTFFSSRVVKMKT